ncbi:MAG: CHASE2 domain-containing protein [Herminiimonas sp.]|nr:CHASE2 domain-containing protein [Herminiimonas sp.]
MALRDWLSLAIALVLLALALGWQNGLGRLDQALYDKFLSAIDQPRRDDIILIAIDDFSLQQLGRWPWPRATHARLLDRLSQAQPKAVGLDVILVEPEAGGGDEALRAALSRNAATVLPVVVTNPGTGLAAGLPIAPLAGAARNLGHINLEHDSDGVVRSVFLHEGINGRWWPYFALALTIPAPAAGAPSRPAPAAPAPPANLASAQTWQRTDQRYVPFAASGQFASVPYVSVLRGEVAPEFFRGKYILIGATALGMSDSYPTPVSGTAGAMPGVEIHANILASLLSDNTIRVASAWQTATLSTLPVLLALIGYLLLSPRLALLIAASLSGLTLLASYLGLRAGIWVAPSAATIVLILSYPLWSWRRLEAAITYLGQEFIRLDHEPHLLPEAVVRARPDLIEDVLERRINAMKTAARRVRDLRRFVSNSLDNLPDATLVTTVDGQVLLANRHAVAYFVAPPGPAGGAPLVGASVLELLSRLQAPQPIDLPANVHFQWTSLLDLAYVDTLGNGVGVVDGQGRDLLVKSAPCYSAAHLLTGWIVSLTDISTIRAAERSRDETLRFLSHDMRAPQASILALLELQEEPASALPQTEFFGRIEKASRRTLGLADNFVQLARAESHEYRLDEVDFRDLLFDATDEMWSLAKSRRIEIVTEIVTEIGEDDYPVCVDRGLMTRALTNLLSNAINYSPDGSRIVCSLTLDAAVQPAAVVCRIRDAGYGIALEDQKKLFQRFARVDLPDQPRHEGIGLGLVFVKTVVERHYGRIGFVSAPGEGTCFTLTLPCHPVTAAAV